MDQIVLVFACLTFLSTLIGGAVILKYKKNLPYFFAFAAGSLIAVAFLDILPEALELAQGINFPVRYVLLIIVFSFFVYSLLERFFLTHELGHSHGGDDDHGHVLGPIGAGTLIIHSFLDGVAIGSAFQVNAGIGIIVAFAVLFHDFTDGINTVTVMLKNKQKVGKAMLFLLFDALAPVAGVLLTSIIFIPQLALVMILSFFVGEFIYIGAASLLPETKKYRSVGITLAIAGGMALIAVLTSFL